MRWPIYKEVDIAAAGKASAGDHHDKKVLTDYMLRPDPEAKYRWSFPTPPLRESWGHHLETTEPPLRNLMNKGSKGDLR
jgi:hypothetical protein